MLGREEVERTYAADKLDFDSFMCKLLAVSDADSNLQSREARLMSDADGDDDLPAQL